MLPAVRRLEEKYPQELVVVGVHSGKFIAERETENILSATRRLGVHHPVVNDRNFRVWRSFGVQAWPTVVLLSPDGRYIGQHAGEFAFEDFDRMFGALAGAYREAGLLSSAPLAIAHEAEPERATGLGFPGKVLADGAGGRLFISDTGNNRVLVARVTGDGASAVVEHAIGDGTAGFADGEFGEARLDHPQGVALAADTLYIADTENHAIRAANLESGALTTVAGTGSIGYERRGGPGNEVGLSSPWDVLESDSYLYIAMAGTHQLWRMYLLTGEVQPFAGSGRENIDDGPNLKATLAQPSGLTTDEQRLFFADSESSALRAADFSPEGYVQTLVGEGLFEFGDRDGAASQVRLQHCLGVAYHDNRIFIADTYNNKVKVYDFATRTVRTVLGTGSRDQLDEPGGISVWDGAGGARLYIADTNNHRVLVAAIEGEGNLGPARKVSLTWAMKPAE